MSSIDHEPNLENLLFRINVFIHYSYHIIIITYLYINHNITPRVILTSRVGNLNRDRAIIRSGTTNKSF